MYTCGIDDSLRQFNIESNSYTDFVVKLNCQPRGLAILRDDKLIILACINELAVVQDLQIVFVLPIKYEANCISINADTKEVAVGGDDQKTHIYVLNGVQLELKVELDHLGAVTDCTYSPNNKYLVACDSHRKVTVYDVTEYKVSKITTRSSKQTHFNMQNIYCIFYL